MLDSVKLLRAMAAALVISVVAGCAEQGAPTSQTAAAASPELGGAWYQVFFDTNSFAINDRGQMMVKNVAYVVANNGATHVNVIGKTDRAGSAAANLALSQRRADAVRDALVAAGVPAARIDTSWTGERKQDVATADDAAEQRNRVVDITVIKTAR